jgi:hypothetical protein
LVESWNGTTVSLDASPNPNTGDNILNAVSCTTATDCQAVGFDDNLVDATTLVESWNGTTWSAVPSPDEGTDNDLLSVSCARANSCQAVGWLDHGLNSTPQQPLAESWDGSTWSIVPMFGPSTTNADFLNSVSCSRVKRCLAVGLYDNSSAGVPAIQMWNGNAWSEISGTVPDPNAGYSSVSCTRPTSCVIINGADALVPSRHHSG